MKQDEGEADGLLHSLPYFLAFFDGVASGSGPSTLSLSQCHEIAGFGGRSRCCAKHFYVQSTVGASGQEERELLVSDGPFGGRRALRSTSESTEGG